MSLNIAEAGKTAVNAGFTQIKTWVIPIVAGTLLICIFVGIVPKAKKFLMP